MSPTDTLPADLDDDDVAEARHWADVGGRCESMSLAGRRCTYCAGHDEVPAAALADPRVGVHVARARTPEGAVPFGIGWYGGPVLEAWDDDGVEKPYWLPPE